MHCRRRPLGGRQHKTGKQERKKEMHLVHSNQLRLWQLIGNAYSIGIGSIVIM